MCNQVKWECRKAKRDYERMISANVKNNPKSFYNYARWKLKVPVTVGNLKGKNGSVAQTGREQAEALNVFFAQEDTSVLPIFEIRAYNSTLPDFEISRDYIEKKLMSLNSNKAAGPDGIYPRVLKELSKELAVPLEIIFRMSTKDYTIPQDWKDGHVSPIFKKGDKGSAENYRPASLTAVACKLMEKFVRDAIMNNLEDNNQFSKFRHGFVKGQLLACIDMWTRVLDEGGGGGGDLDIIYLDFQKAFDTVPHQRLRQKLYAYGMQ